MTTNDINNFKGYIKCILLDEGCDAEDYRDISYLLHDAIERGISEVCEEQGINDYEGWVWTLPSSGRWI